MADERVIIHVDMDAFFAAVEQRDHPEYRGKPVVVGADPKGGRGRGVVSTCSYEAREYGIHSAMPISEAYRRCPHAVFLPVRMSAYREVSQQIREIFREFTPVIEPLSIDEAFLDVTGSLRLFGGKRKLARELQDRIKERTGLTASLGVAPNKLVAKIASDLEKPQGLVIVDPGEVREFLRPMPVGRLWGVGPKTEEALEKLNIQTIGDLADRDPKELEMRFGKHGREMWRRANGRDDRPVKTNEEVKSVGHEHTFETDTADPSLLASTLMKLSEKVAHRLRKGGLQGRTVTTKLRFEDFTTLTRATTLDKHTDNAPEIYAVASRNLDRIDMAGRRVRLIGVTVSGLHRGEIRQTSLFEPREEEDTGREKKRLLGQVIDLIRGRFGRGAIKRGTSLLGEGQEKGNEK